MILSGTGCCSIYPLLGCRLRPQWKFLATGKALKQNCRLLTDYSLDIDENNARTAEQNVKLNELESRIRIARTDPKDPLFPLDKFGQKR
jgi:23S rRNA (adenine1618-N6)-methyltransferase